MARSDIRLDSDGIVEVLNSDEVRDAIHGLAESIADEVRDSVEAENGVVVDDYTTDRAASSVTIRDAQGKLWQVRDGVLTRAAAGVGLEVTERSDD